MRSPKLSVREPTLSHDAARQKRPTVVSLFTGAGGLDIGLEKAAFLYVGDYFESTFETGDDGEGGGRGRRGGGRGGRGSRSAPPRTRSTALTIT